MSWVVGADQGQGMPKSSMSTYRGTYKSPTNKVLTLVVGFKRASLWDTSLILTSWTNLCWKKKGIPYENEND